MDSFPFITDLALVVAAAALAGLLCDRFRIPRVLGYIAAGVLLGPHTPFYVVSSPATIQTLGSLGIIFLMMSLGMSFNPIRIRQTGYGPIIVALIDSSFMIWLGWIAGGFLGWSTLGRVFLGVMLCDSSTVVLAKMLDGLEGSGHGPFGRFVVGVTILEDIFSVCLIALLNGLALQQAVQAGAVAMRVFELAVFLTSVTIFGFFFVPRLLRYVERVGHPETLLLVMAGLGFLVSYVAYRLGLSLALGAFVIGAVIGESPRALQRREPVIRPLAQLFVAVFFVYIGLELDPVMLWTHAPLIALLSALVIGGKLLACTMMSMGVGLAPAMALRAGAGLAQVCEFALIVAALGVSLKALPSSMLHVAAGVVLVTMLLNPLLQHGAERAIVLLNRIVPLPWVERIRQYTGWLGWVRSKRFDTAVGRAVRRSFWVIFLNLLLIASLLGLARFLSRWPMLFDWVPAWAGGPDTIFWLGAMLLSLPMYVTVIRKMHALALVAAEISVPVHSGAPWLYRLRLLMANVITSLGLVVIAALTLLLSSALLPRWPVVAVCAALMTFLMWRGWYALGRFYTEWQFQLRSLETE
jgi:CPA2 family monovalent cation:H+ antiporter-2